MATSKKVSNYRKDEYYEPDETTGSFYEAPVKQEEPIETMLDSKDLMLVLNSVDLSVLGVMGRVNYNLLSKLELIPALYNKVVIDNVNGLYTVYGNQGQIIHRQGWIASHVELLSKTKVSDFNTDIFGNFLLEERPKQKEKDFSGRKQMNFNRLMLSIENHKEYWDTFNTPLVDDETTLEKLIRVAVLQPDQFDEIFTIEKDRPESPLMRKFLQKLSELVNDQLKDNDEGIDNIEELQKKAYEYASYQGKDLETVVSESKDYYNYFRYLLTKGEKIVISEQESDYFKSIVKVSSKIKELFKRKEKDYEISDIINGSTLFYFTQKIPVIHIGREKVEVTHFIKVSKIRNAISEIENCSNFTSKVALIDQLVSKDIAGTTKNKDNILTKIVAIDDYCNYNILIVKKTTMSKWARNLDKLIDISESVHSHGRTFRAYGLDDGI